MVPVNRRRQQTTTHLLFFILIAVTTGTAATNTRARRGHVATFVSSSSSSCRHRDLATDITSNARSSAASRLTRPSWPMSQYYSNNNGDSNGENDGLLTNSQQLVSFLADMNDNAKNNDNDTLQEAELRLNKIRAAITSLESSSRSSSSSSHTDNNGSTSIDNTRNNNNHNNPNNDNDDDIERFNPLIGLYQVQYVLSPTKQDNPVGGKWTRSNGLVQRIFRTRTTFQHILPFNSTGLAASKTYPAVVGCSTSTNSSSRGSNNNDEEQQQQHSSEVMNAVAEAINIISLDALDGLFRVTVILRGDAVPLSLNELNYMNSNRTTAAAAAVTTTTATATLDPLSNLAVRAYFDPPRIFLGKRRTSGRQQHNNDYAHLPLQIGPISSVVLDTTYNDDIVRIGMGGTSGTRFVFARCGDGTTTMEEGSSSVSNMCAPSLMEEEANEYQVLLKQPPAKKVKILSGLGGFLAISLCVALGSGGDVVSELWNRFRNGAMFMLARFGITAGSSCRGNIVGALSPLTSFIAKIKMSTIFKMTRLWTRIGMRFIAAISSIIAGLGIAAISFSSGGIERDGMMSPPSESSSSST